MVDFSLCTEIGYAPCGALRDAGGRPRAHHRERRQIPGGGWRKRDTIVFDKTGTLTHACPRVAEVVPFNGKDEAEMLRLAACLEEHFPHSMANAVVEEARRRGPSPRGAPCHGGVSGGPWDCQFGGSGAGAHCSAHFIFEDEQCVIPEDEQAKFDALVPGRFPNSIWPSDGGALRCNLHIRPPAGGGRRTCSPPSGAWG